MVRGFFITLQVINFCDSKVLDSSTGKPAQGVAIHLEYLESDIFHPLVKGYNVAHLRNSNKFKLL